MQDQIVLAELHLLGATYSVCDDLPEGQVGDSDGFTRHIRVRRGMTMAETRCTLMHECGHLALNLWPTGDPEEDDLREWQATRWAAHKLITDAMLVWANECGRDDREIAEMLGVDPETLAARMEDPLEVTVNPRGTVRLARHARAF